MILIDFVLLDNKPYYLNNINDFIELIHLKLGSDVEKYIQDYLEMLNEQIEDSSDKCFDYSDLDDAIEDAKYDWNIEYNNHIRKCYKDGMVLLKDYIDEYC